MPARHGIVEVFGNGLAAGKIAKRVAVGFIKCAKHIVHLQYQLQLPKQLECGNLITKAKVGGKKRAKAAACITSVVEVLAAYLLADALYREIVDGLITNR